MTQQAQPQWPRLGGCPWLNLAPLCCTLTQFPAHSLAFPQAPTEPRPAAWVYAARSQAHSVGPTPQDGPRLRREVDGVGSIFFVNGGSTSHVDLARVGRELRLGE